MSNSSCVRPELRLIFSALALFGLLQNSCHPSEILAIDEESMTRGVIVMRHLGGDRRQKYFLYVPSSAVRGASVLVLVHGASRNAETYVNRFRSLSDRYGVVLVAPHFSKSGFPDYHRLEPGQNGKRPSLVLHDILAEVGSSVDINVSRVYLFGFSAGGQFVHRYAMSNPEKTAAVAIGAAGWYTFPDPRLPFPQGLKVKSPPVIIFEPLKFLRIPAAVFVGDRDFKRNRWLNKSDDIDRQQGRTRIERASQWIRAMRAAAASYGIPARIELHVMPGVGHSFVAAMEQGRMGQRVFNFLYPPRSSWDASDYQHP